MNITKRAISHITHTFVKSCSVRTFCSTDYEEILDGNKEYEQLRESYLNIGDAKSCYIIQPYVKWGPKKIEGISPEEQLSEAKALVDTLPTWRVEDSIIVPLETLDQKTLFRSGNLEKLRQIVWKNARINTVFINKGTLKKAQIKSLEAEFKVPIIDRYKLVMQILKKHATSKHAKLQVALAELYYLQRSLIHDGNFGNVEKEKLKLVFQTREGKLKEAIKELRAERVLLRKRRTKNEYPTVAVVGYTNAGKTSVIKALTGEENLVPKNQLFATLDVTVHQGVLPTGLAVLYVDTVGFISDIPTTLIECFVATLEDALLADVILHVEDISSANFEYKRKHVLNTLESLAKKGSGIEVMDKIIAVGNKCDLVDKDQDFGLLKVSSTTEIGLDVLRLELEQSILKNTNRKRMKIRIPSGGDEMRWLYKNSTLISETCDPKDSNLLIIDLIITQSKLQQFKHRFVT